MIRLELNQTRLRGGARIPRTLLLRVMREVARALHLQRSVRLSAAFVSPKEMRRLNRLYRGKDRLTDVLSFPFKDRETQGEILLSYEQAARQAKVMKHSVRQELVFLLVHGALHVFGYDHESEREAARMFALQCRILDRLHVC